MDIAYILLFGVHIIIFIFAGVLFLYRYEARKKNYLLGGGFFTLSIAGLIDAIGMVTAFISCRISSGDGWCGVIVLPFWLAAGAVGAIGALVTFIGYLNYVKSKKTPRT